MLAHRLSIVDRPLELDLAHAAIDLLERFTDLHTPPLVHRYPTPHGFDMPGEGTWVCLRPPR